MPVELMRAAYISGPGPASDIQVGTLPVPEPGPTDVLVKVQTSVVNQVDTYVRAGSYVTAMPTPFVVGRDLVGTVAVAGAGSGFTSGEPVWCNSLGHGGRQGACAEYAVVPADRLYRLPTDVDPAHAVASLHPAATAFLGLCRYTNLRAGQTILVGGAAGNIGAISVQLAREAGLRVLATARREDHELVRGLGAEIVLDYRDPDLTEQIRAAAPAGVDAYWDTSGRGQLADAAKVTAERGRIIVAAGRQPQRELSMWPIYTRDVQVVGFVISLATVSELAAAAATINRRLAGPGLFVRVAHELPLDEAARAHELVEAGTRGRVVIRIGREEGP